MRWQVFMTIAVAALLTGSIQQVNSPGAAADPIPATAEELQAYIGVAEEMHTRWVALDATCDPDAVFALLYLVTTAKVGDLVAADHFEDNGLLVAWDQDFAQRYFDAYDAYHFGGDVPEAWRVAFEHADSGNSTAMEDLLLGMSAHVNYDLAHSAYGMGLPQAGLKDEYDRVNDAFWNVVVPVGDEIGGRYDPSMAREDDELGPLDYGIVELLISWRENAWQNAVLLAEAEGDPIATALVEAKIEGEARFVAEGLTNDNGDTAPGRIAYCDASGHPPLASHLGGPGYGDDWFPAAHEEVAICHKPGTPGQRNMTVNDHALAAHEHHGDTAGACA